MTPNYDDLQIIKHRNVFIRKKQQYCAFSSEYSLKGHSPVLSREGRYLLCGTWIALTTAKSGTPHGIEQASS